MPRDRSGLSSVYEEEDKILPSMLRIVKKLEESNLISVEECELFVRSEFEQRRLERILPPEISERVRFHLKEHREEEISP